MKRFYRISLWLLVVLVSHYAKGQLSPNTIKYEVTYNATTQTYTTYVIPQYNVPNSNNTLTTERGGTAQFTLVVPTGFIISTITDVNGQWDKNPTKLGPGQPNQNWSAFNLNPLQNYYVIGKSPSETDYGTFASGQRVALFTFKGNGCFGPISVLPVGDPFISAADNAYSLNVANSFNSRSAQGTGGNVVPLEQFSGVNGIAAACTPPTVLTALPDNVTTTVGTATTTPVLTNDTNTGQPASITNVTVTITTPPTVGTAVVNTDGTITYTPPATYTGLACYTYKICDKTSTTVCSSAQVCVTVVPKPIGNADLQITKTLVGAKIRALNDVITYTIEVKNIGPDAATNVVVKDSLGAGLQFQSAVSTAGTFTNSLLTIPTLSSGQSATLTVTAKIIAEGISFNYARVVSQDQNDPNKTNNQSQACVSVPVNVCQTESILATVPANITNVQWYKDNVLVGSGNSITLSESGTYTFTASNNTCPAEGCCPLIIVQQICCPVNACVPFVITRTKRK